MKTGHKTILLLILIGALISPGIIASAQTASQWIEVIFNHVNLVVDQQKVETDNLLYNGVTYAPVRAVAEMLGKEVHWCGATNTASITSPAAPSETPSSDKLIELPLQSDISAYGPVMKLPSTISNDRIVGLSVCQKGQLLPLNIHVGDREIELTYSDKNRIFDFDSVYSLRIFMGDGRWYNQDFQTGQPSRYSV